MKRVLLVVGLVLVAVVTVGVLGMALAWGLDRGHCKIGFPSVISCTFEW
jgi:hypothetical protein